MTKSAKAEAQALEYVAANIRMFRLDRGITQERLAELADLDLSYVQRVERAATNLSVRVLVRIASALEISPGRLFRPAKRNPSARGRPRRSGQ